MSTKRWNEMCRQRRKRSLEFRAKVAALAASREDAMIAELAKRFDLYAKQTMESKKQFVQRVVGCFNTTSASAIEAADVKRLHAKIGKQALEIDLLSGALDKNRIA
jgi:transposase